MDKGLVLDNYPLDEYQKYSELFERDLYEEISLETCVNKRLSEGGASPKSVYKQVKWVREQI